MPMCAMLFTWSGLLLVTLWIAGQILTDRYAWSQWVWWVPSAWWVLFGWGLLIGSLLLRRTGKKQKRKRPFFLRRRLVQTAVLAGCVGMVLNLVFVDQRWQNGVMGHGVHWARGADDGKVRVVHWNLSAGEIDVDQAVGWIDELNIDVVLIANPRWDGQRGELVEGLKGVVGEEGTVRRLPRAVVASRFGLVGSSVVYLSASGGEGNPEEAMRATGDFGWVALLRFDGGKRFGEFDVWFVDLPSEPMVHRMESMGRVVGLLKERDLRLNPALIIGDFNTVRGSASLGLFDEFEDGGGFVDAFEACGAFGGSWRPTGMGGVKGWVAQRSSWHIDLSLVGNGWGIDGYELVTPNGADWGREISHRAQVVDIER